MAELDKNLNPKKKQTETEDYYNDLRNKSYRTLLDNEIQASIAKEQAMKYTQNSMAAQGLGSQGVSESVKAGINNDYLNAIAKYKGAYNDAVLGYNAEERKENLENYKTNAGALAETLKGYYKYGIDSDGNQTLDSIDVEAYKNALKNYGVEFDELGNANFDNALVSDKAALKTAYEDMLNEYNTLGQKEVNNTTVKVDNTKTFKQTNGNVINFFDDSKKITNSKFAVQDSNGNTSSWVLGSKISNYSGRVDVGQVQNEATTKATGDIWLSTKANPAGKNLLTLVVKDKEGNARAVETSTDLLGFKNSTNTAIDSIIKLYNQYSDLDLKQSNKNDRYAVVDKNGNKYRLYTWPDGSFFLKEQK